jgi:hypothetical protein
MSHREQNAHWRIPSSELLIAVCLLSAKTQLLENKSEIIFTGQKVKDLSL